LRGLHSDMSSAIGAAASDVDKLVNRPGERLAGEDR
jgi:hypothetical protein